MRNKEVSMSVKQAIMKLKNENKSIREIAETLGVSKSTVGYIVKKHERTGELSNSKRSGRPRKTTVGDDQRILSIVKKKPFLTAIQIKNTLQDIGVDVSTTTIKRRLHQNNYKWFTTRHKPQDDMASLLQDQSGMSLLQDDMASQPEGHSGISLLQEQVRREILQRMQTRFSSIINNETMDMEYLLDVAQQELALARATSHHINIPEELVCSLQELIYRLSQSMESVVEAPVKPSDVVTVTVNDPPSSE